MLVVHVPPQWPRRTPCKIAFVAEAPSWEEIEHKPPEPLVGPSGRVFNMLLRTAGLDRSECLVTNVFDEKLPDNDVGGWCVGLRDARDAGLTDLPPIGSSGFLLDGHRYHLGRLGDELRRCQPTVIVPLGNTALWALMGHTGITSYRGQPTVATKIVPGVKILPTLHPAAVMRQWQNYSVVVADLIKAKREADRGPHLILPKRELLLEPTLGDLEAYLPRLYTSDLLSVDIETGWGQITSIGFAPDAEHGICIPFVDKRRADRNYWSSLRDEATAWKLIGSVLISDGPKLGQNFGGYDAFWLLRKRGILVRNMLHDTRLLQHNLYPELPKSLAFMGNSYGTQGTWKDWGKKGAKRDD